MSVSVSARTGWCLPLVSLSLVMQQNRNVIHLRKPDIFSFGECLHFLDRGYDDCLYSVEEGRVIKALKAGGPPVLFEVTENGDGLTIGLLSADISNETAGEVEDFVSEWFDLERDLRPFYRLLKNHSRLSWMAESYRGLRLMGIPDLFEALCWCVIGQQINLTFAHRLKRRLVENHGDYLTYDSKRYYLFPETEVLAGLEVDELRELQFSRQKAEYIIGIARAFSEEGITKESLSRYDTSGPMLERLMKIRGVGEWTANYVLMKSLKRMDCITWGDTGLQSAVASTLELDRKPKRQEVEELFDKFPGWESYLVIYLWRSLS